MPKTSNYNVNRRDNGCRAMLSWVRSGREAVILLVLVTLIASCGFHLRGKIQLPAVFSATHVKGTDLSLVDDIKRALRVAGGAVVNEKAEATVSIELLRVKYSRAVRSINEQGIAVGYELHYEVSYRVSGLAKQRLVPDARIALKRTVMVFGEMNEPPGVRLRIGLTGLTMAEYFRDRENQDVLLFIDNIYRYILAGMEV
ncbi:MAG TPA: hypothetical protein EYO82_10830, partial [Gammaproteobacteria bacterium]|nr:hypothetical protein [Gammaproteobacteria bacterium]